MKKTALAPILFTFLLLVTPALCSAHREITNKSSQPVRVLDLNDENGKPFARLFMTGESMSIDHYNYPESGAGYYEAMEGQSYFIPFTRGGLGGLQVDRVEWDETGKVVSIKGLRPFFDGAEQIPIVSDVNNLKIENGVLYLKLKGTQHKEHKFSIHFGVGTAIEPSLYE